MPSCFGRHPELYRLSPLYHERHLDVYMVIAGHNCRRENERASAALQCDAFSAQLLQSLPNKYYALSPANFADSFSRYLGAPIYSVLKGKLQNKPIPCSWNGVRGRATRRCGPFGHELELATISDNSHWRESTAIEKAIYESMKFAGIQVTRQDNLTFRGLVPPTAADGDRELERAPLVPDIKATLSYDGGKTPEQDFIFDVKTARRSASTDYKCREAYDTPHGVVDKRAAAVPKEYMQKARRTGSMQAEPQDQTPRIQARRWMSWI